MHPRDQLVPAFAEAVGLAPPHRARCCPLGPGWVFHGPFLDVEIERADTHKDLKVAELTAVSPGTVGANHGSEALLPSLGDVGRQVQRLEVRVMMFDIGPEIPDEQAGKVLERVVVQAGTALVEVAHQHRTNSAVAQPVPVADLTGGTLAEPDSF